MKLELKHIAPYKPYELNYLYDGKIYIFNSSIGDLTIGYDDNQDSWHSIQNCKPILHPLSDLLDNEDIRIAFDDELNEFDTQYLCEAIVNGTPYVKDIWRTLEVLEVLYRLHLDIYGLIEAGLAIDINTLNKEQ